jgi:hypothetical protein
MLHAICAMPYQYSDLPSDFELSALRYQPAPQVLYTSSISVMAAPAGTMG